MIFRDLLRSEIEKMREIDRSEVLTTELDKALFEMEPEDIHLELNIIN
jgi:hypothetical protein